MHKCPKCSTIYADEARICRTCGAILEAYVQSQMGKSTDENEELVMMANMAETLPSEMGSLSESSDINKPAWDCLRCHESVPGKFDICWNCFADREGAIDPEFAEIASADQEDNRETDSDSPDDDRGDFESIVQAEIEKTPPSQLRKTAVLACLRCGSEKMVRDAQVLDRDRGHGDATVAVYGDPNAILFKDALYGILRADICGQCGHVELHVDNPTELYDHYRRAKE